MQATIEDSIKKAQDAKPEYQALMRQLCCLSFSPEFPYIDYFYKCYHSILQADEIHRLAEADPLFTHLGFQMLKKVYDEYYECLSPEGYESCIANPDYILNIMDKDFGALFSSFFMQIRQLLRILLRGDYHIAVQILKLYLKYLEQAKSDELVYEQCLRDYRDFSWFSTENTLIMQSYRAYDPSSDIYRNILEKADLNNFSYLYSYGIYIDDSDVALARFMANYDEISLKRLAAFIVKSWTDGFERAKRDYRQKRYPRLVFPCGMERLARMVLDELKALEMEPLVSLPINSGINRQVEYDHRFDSALIWDQEFADMMLKTNQATLEQLKDKILMQAGPVYIDLFGEKPFVPKQKASALSLSAEQQKIFRDHSAKNSQLMHQYYKRDETSFTIIAFPSPKIGENFAEIFNDILKINLMDSQRYAHIQQRIIDVLDTADYVHVKGRAGNETDIKVKMHKITDPSRQTLFENCVADVNIPVGEVFTSPVLEGTNGTLHVEDIYLNSLRFFDLKIIFEDGWIKDYSCSNFPEPEAGKKYIHENLLLPHESLPIGEFAIGTNTLAYQIARKYDIQALLPILIIEKMGPHFAIGDTCYSHEEEADHSSFLNGKEMIAVDNEKSILRKTDPLNAYTNKHLDITLPYDMLQNISAIAEDGSSSDIIRDGLFVVSGTQELNIPLQGL